MIILWFISDVDMATNKYRNESHDRSLQNTYERQRQRAEFTGNIVNMGVYWGIYQKTDDDFKKRKHIQTNPLNKLEPSELVGPAASSSSAAAAAWSQRQPSSSSSGCHFTTTRTLSRTATHTAAASHHLHHAKTEHRMFNTQLCPLSCGAETIVRPPCYGLECKINR